MIRITGSQETIKRIARMQGALTPQAIDQVVDRVALETHANLVKATPKRWTGQTRAAWQIISPSLGVRIIRNDSKVMAFLERGTANNGQGYILPKKGKYLYIPLTRRAMGGWRQGFVYGRDYILKTRVRGIKARRIAEQEEVRARIRLRAAFVEHVRKAVGDG